MGERKMIRYLVPILVAAAPAAAEMPFTYEMFETSVEHMDLAECPGDMKDEAAFCRVTMATDGVHVFKFSYEGEQELLDMRSFYDDEISGVWGM